MAKETPPPTSTTGPAPALLAMEDGTVYRGIGFGAINDGAGEIVFNTAITGYQEVLTDPSYRGQIVTMTAPEIGNVGVNPVDFESPRPWCAGFVVRELSPVVSNWRASGGLDALLRQHGVAGISGIDTRAVTRRIRLSGAQRAVITRNVADPAGAVERSRKHPSLEGRDLVREVTTREAYAWVVPAATSAKEALSLKPDGIFLSNGPGDPAAVDYAVESARALCKADLPVFGICLGHQILGLALGGKTYKLKFGHHGANHPVMDLSTQKVEITSQNHGFAVDVDSLQGKAVLSHVSLNDKTVEGMHHGALPVFSVQYHPEASPGPNDATYLFDRFTALMDQRRRK